MHSKIISQNIHTFYRISGKRFFSKSKSIYAANGPKLDITKYYRHTAEEGFVRTSPFETVILPTEKTLSEFVWKNYTKWQTKTAIVCGLTGRSYTYAQLRDQSAAFAIRLQKVLKHEHNDVIAICMPNIPEYPIVMFGAIEAGMVATTINPIYTPAEIEKQLSSSNTKSIVCTVGTYTSVQEAVNRTGKIIKVICIKTAADQSLPKNAINFFDLAKTENINFSDLKSYDIDSNDMALLPYSSGTTGLPKGVMLSHRNIISNIAQSDIKLPYEHIIRDTTETYQDVVPGILPFFHSYGLTVGMCFGLFKGTKIVSLPTFVPDVFLRVCTEHRPTVMNLVPPLVLFLADNKMAESKHLETVRTVMIGAAPIGQQDAERFCKKAPKVDFIHGFGLTEASPVVCLTFAGSQDITSIGVSVSLTEAKIADPSDQKYIGLGPNQRGELLFRGPQVMKGYLNNPKATKETITEDGWLRTGDMGYYDENGYLYVTDRLKELIKVKGYQVAPAELEALLRNHPGVLDAAVVAVPHDKYGEVPKAFVVQKKDTSNVVSEKVIQEYVKENAAEYKHLLGGVMFLDSIPKNATGKIMRRKLKEQYCT